MWEDLALAVCAQAAEDYIRARKFLYQGTQKAEIEWLDRHLNETCERYEEFGFDHPRTKIFHRMNRKAFHRRKAYRFHVKNLQESQEFITSGRFEFYSGLDGEEVMERLRNRCNRRQFGKVKWT